jgi:hypothetical protein
VLEGSSARRSEKAAEIEAAGIEAAERAA